MKIRKAINQVVVYAILLIGSYAILGNQYVYAGDFDSFIGTWSWLETPYKVRVAPCGNTVCGTIIAGPKNVGDQLVGGVKSDGDSFTGKLFHPSIGQTYFIKVTVINEDKLRVSGCTAKGVCTQSIWQRVDNIN